MELVDRAKHLLQCKDADKREETVKFIKDVAENNNEDEGVVSFPCVYGLTAIAVDKNIEKFDFKYIDTKTFTSLGAAFANCKKLTEVNFGKNFDTSNVTNMQSIFTGCGSLKKLDFRNTNFDTSKIIQINFTNCNSLTELYLGDNFDTSKFTTMVNQFYGCAFEELDLGDKFDTSNVTTMLDAFAACTKLVELNVGDKFNLIKSTNNRIFGNCRSLTTIKGRIYNIKADIPLNTSPLDLSSAKMIIDGLYDFAAEGDTATHTVTFSATTKGYLTEADIKVATDKGWTVA